MPKTYNTFTNVSTGDPLPATTFNNLLTNVANYRVPPMCVLQNSTAQTIALTTQTALTYPLAAEIVDTDDMHNTSSNTSRITINTAGIYIITCAATWAGANPDGSRILMVLTKNGSEISTEGSRIDTGNYGANTAIAVSLSITVNAAVADYFEWTAYHTGSVNRNVNASHFAATWQGQAS